MRSHLGRGALFLSWLVLALAGCDPAGPRAGAVLPTRVPPSPGPSPTALYSPTAVVFPSPATTETPLSTSTLTSTPTGADLPTFTPTTVPTSAPGLTPVSIPLVYGDVAQGTISDDAPVALFVFPGTAGDVVTLGLSRQSGDLDAFLSLEDPRGREIAANDDARNVASPGDARIERLRLPVSGPYTVVATRFQRELGTTGGAFALSLDRAEVATGPDTRQPIAYGEIKRGVIGSGTPRVEYVFSGRGGDVIAISLRRLQPADDLDPYLLLLDAAGRQLAFSDDAPEPANPDSINARIDRFILPVDGDYVIVATRFLEAGGTTQGTFELALSLNAQ